MAAAPIRVISLSPTKVATLEPRRAATVLQSAILYGAAGLLMFGPLAFGAVEPWSIFVVEAGSAGLFLMWVAKTVLAPSARFRWSPLFAPMLLFAAVVALQVALGTTVYRYASTSVMMQYIAYGALCFVVLQALETTEHRMKLSLQLSVFGFSLAAFALIQALSSNGKLYWLRTPKFGGWIYGPYVNHNHYAGLMEMLVPIPLLLCLNQKSPGAQKFLTGFAALLMAATIFLSGSRGGMVAFSIEAVVLVAIVCRENKSRSTIAATVAFAILLGALIGWIDSSSVGARWHDVHFGAELSAGGRLTIYKDAVQMFNQRPLLGWGLGDFANVYPQYRSFYTNLYVNAAHNDYLQTLVETGALGGLAVVWFVVVLCRTIDRKLQGALEQHGLSIAALAGCTGILVHSLVDFNLQVPANAALFYVLATIATAPVER